MSRRLTLLSAVVVVWLIGDVAWAQSFLDRFRNAAQEAEEPEANLAQPRTTGTGYLGLTGDELVEEDGVLVADVDEGAPAARAGFRPGDRIIRMNGTEITGLEDLARLLQRRRAGDRVTFVIERDGRQQNLSATLTDGRAAEEPLGDDELPPPVPTGEEPEDQSPVLGVNAAPISEPLRERYGFIVAEGAVIAGIEPGSPAHRSRLPIGGVIVDVNGQAIASPDDLQSIVSSASAGDEFELTYYIGEQRYRTKLKLAPAVAPPPARALRPDPDPPMPQRGTPATDLENRLGEGGRRPLLGRIGRVLDDIAEDEMPADEGPDLEPADGDDASPSPETELLREEVELLRREIDLLRRRVDELERSGRRD